MAFTTSQRTKERLSERREGHSQPARHAPPSMPMHSVHRAAIHHTPRARLPPNSRKLKGSLLQRSVGTVTIDCCFSSRKPFNGKKTRGGAAVCASSSAAVGSHSIFLLILYTSGLLFFFFSFMIISMNMAVMLRIIIEENHSSFHQSQDIRLFFLKKSSSLP